VLFEGRIETINFQENFDLQVTLVSTPALEAERFTFRCKCTAGERRLLDQRIAPETNCQVASILLDCYDRGGFFWGAFENDKLIGVSVLESKLIGSHKDMLQLKFLHVDRDFRGQGLGTKLFDVAVQKARELGARKLYISATPSEHTVNYYMRLGCILASELDPELFALEPEDIHLEYAIP
jgi:GNAT superfamily N-acetyltransferase